MEAKVKKREWVKTAAIIFLAILLVLTFFSNTIMNASLPEVAAQSVTSGAINAKIRGSGTIAANETYDVTISQTRKIASVKVKVGQQVNAGDVLFTLEAAESDELKQAQDALEALERAYEKALLSAATSDAQENREVEKAREAYNEALAIYRQYSTMDAANLVMAQAEADAELKELQRQSKDAQDAVTKAQSDTEYTETKANIVTYEAQMQTAETALKSAGYEVPGSWVTAETTQNEIRKIQNDLADYNNASSDMYIAKLLIDYEQYYQILSKLSSDRQEIMEEYCKDANRTQLVRELEAGGYLNTGGGSSGTDDTMPAYASGITDPNVQDYYTLAERLVEAFKKLNPYYYGQAELERLSSVLEYVQARDELAAAEDAVEYWEGRIEDLQNRADALAEDVDDQQAEVEKLASAASAAETVKSTKQALEDLIFAQSLGDTASLDLKDQKEDIEKQKLAIEELTKDADGQDVTAKVSGIVSEINVTAGNTAGADSPLCTINVADRGYTIKIPVTQEQARRVSVGDNAELVNYWGGNVTATLESVANDPENPGKGKLLIFRLSGEVDPGTNLTLSIGQKSANYDALVPNSAIRTDNNGSFVLALVAKSTPLSTRYTATRVDVQELAKDDTYTAVSGIGAGEFVITTSTKPIEAGTQVRLVDEP